jgi:tetratricopeptide (TPR) repeat protein
MKDERLPWCSLTLVVLGLVGPGLTCAVAQDAVDAPIVRTQDKAERLEIAREALRAHHKAGFEDSRYFARRAVQAMVRLGDPQAARELLSRAATHVLASDRDDKAISTRTSDLLLIVRTQLKIGDEDGATKTLEFRPAEGERPYSFFRLQFEDMPLISLLKRIGKGDEADKALEGCVRAVEQAPDDPQQGPMKSALPALRIFRGDLDDAIQALDALQDEALKDTKGPTPFARGLWLMAYTLRFMDRADAVKLLPRILERLPLVQDASFRDTLRTNSGFSLRTGLHDDSEAINLIRQIENDQPDGTGMNISRKAFGLDMIAQEQYLTGRLDAARATAQEAFRAASAYEFSKSSYFFLKRIASLMAELGDIDGALRVSEKMPVGERFSVLMEAALASELVDHQDSAARYRHLAERDLAAWRKDKEFKDDVFVVPAEQEEYVSRAVQYHAYSLDFDSALNWANSQRLMCWVARTQARAGHGREALNWCRTRQWDPGPYTSPYLAIIEGLDRAQVKADADRAREKADRAREKAERLEIAREVLRARREAGPNSFGLQANAEASVLRRLGDEQAAREVLAESAGQLASRDMTLSGRYSSSTTDWALIAHSQIAMGDRDAARETLRLTVLDPRPLQRPSDVNFMAAVVALWKELGEDVEADAAFRRYVDMVKARIGESRPAMLAASLAGLRLAIGDVEGAFDSLVEIEATGRDKPDTQLQYETAFINMAQTCRWISGPSQKRHLARVLEQVPKLEAAKSRDRVRINVEIAFSCQDHFDESLRVARLVGESNGDADQRTGNSTALALTSVANALLQKGDAIGARNVLHEAFDVTLAFEIPGARKLHLSTLTMLMIDAGDLKGAVKCADGIPDGERAYSLARIALEYANRGELGEAERFLEKAREDHQIWEEAKQSEPEGGQDAASVSEGLQRQIWILACGLFFDRAREFAAGFSSEGAQMAALVKVARIQARAGYARAALEWVHERQWDPRLESPYFAIIQEVERAQVKADSGP